MIVEDSLILVTKDGETTHINELTDAGISFIPIGNNGMPKLKYSELRSKGDQITVETFGKPKSWWTSSIYGVQIMTGGISKRMWHGEEQYIVDIDIESQMVENHNELFQTVWDTFTQCCEGSPFLVNTKSGGRRISAWSPYKNKVVKFVDTTEIESKNRFPMAMEIMSENGLSRYDERYEIVEGSLTNLPTISASVIQEIIDLVQSHEGIGRLAYRKGAKKDMFVPQFDTSEYQLPNDIEFVSYSKDGRSSQVSSKQYKCVINPTHENDDVSPSMSYWNNPDGSIATFCFKCDFGINLKRSDNNKTNRRQSKPSNPTEKEVSDEDGTEFDASTLEDFDVDDMYIGGNEIEKPEIYINFQSDTGNNRPDPIIVDEALDALINSNKQNPEVFHRGGQLCQVRTDELNQLGIEQLSVSGVRSRMSRSADWYKWVLVGRGKNRTAEKRNVTVPLHITQYLMATESLQEFYALQGIVNHPVLREDGSWHSMPGYDEHTQYYINPESVTGLQGYNMSVDEAISIIFEDLLVDFPFDSEASSTNAIAFALNPLIRPIVKDAPTPLFVFDAPVSRTGKGLLIDTLHRVVTGLPANVSTPAENEEEWEKRIITSLVAGTEIVFYDEVETSVKKPLRSGKLRAAITAPQFSGRLLGSNTLISVPVRCTWVIAGNTIYLGEDLLNRSVIISLVSDTENPEDRDPSKFKHNLPSWASQNRSKLLGALMTLIDEWVRQGAKRPSARLAGFEDWVSITTGILDAVGLSGLLNNRSDFMQRANTEREALKLFAETVVEQFGENPWLPGEVAHIATYDDEDDGMNILGDFIWSKTYRGRVQQIGHLLKKKLKAIYSGYRLDAWSGSTSQGQKYFFKHVDEPKQPSLFEEDEENTETVSTSTNDDIPF